VVALGEGGRERERERERKGKFLSGGYPIHAEVVKRLRKFAKISKFYNLYPICFSDVDMHV
jgi:hypothetical protein